MERIICPRCKAIRRSSVCERCPVCGAELVTPQKWNSMRESILGSGLIQKSQPVANWGLKFLLGVVIGCLAFGVIILLAKM